MPRKKSGAVPFMVRLMPKQLEVVDDMIDKQIYPNRSECIRDAVRRLIENYQRKS